MSGQPLAVVREAVEAWNARDVERLLALATPDFEWTPAGAGAVAGAVYRGRAECAVALNELFETWEGFHMEEAQVRDLGDRMLWLGHVRARGAGSALELDTEFSILIGIRGGRPSSMVAFFSWREGLAAAGL